MKFIDFGVFQNFKQMLSHDKIIFHMLFGAFQITPRIDQNVHHFIFGKSTRKEKKIKRFCASESACKTKRLLSDSAKSATKP